MRRTLLTVLLLAACAALAGCSNTQTHAKVAPVIVSDTPAGTSGRPTMSTDGWAALKAYIPLATQTAKGTPAAPSNDATITPVSPSACHQTLPSGDAQAQAIDALCIAETTFANDDLQLQRCVWNPDALKQLACLTYADREASDAAQASNALLLVADYLTAGPCQSFFTYDSHRFDWVQQGIQDLQGAVGYYNSHPATTPKMLQFAAVDTYWSVRLVNLVLRTDAQRAAVCQP